MEILVTFKKFYTYIKIIIYVLLFITIFGLNKIAPEYLDELNIIIKVLICGFLIYRFNPFSNINTFDEFDKTIVFDSAICILSTSLIISIIEIFKKKITMVSKNINLLDKNNKNNKNNKNKK